MSEQKQMTQSDEARRYLEEIETRCGWPLNKLDRDRFNYLSTMAGLHLALSIAQSLETLAGTVIANSLPGYAASISVDDGRS